MKKWLNISGLVIGMICFYIFFKYFFDWKTVKELLKDAQVTLIFLSMCFFLFTILMRALKWTYIIKLKEHVTWVNGYHTIMISNMANYFFPIRIGEILKLYVINKKSGISYPTSISATLSDRFSQFMLVILFLMFTPVAGFRFSQWSSKYIFLIGFFFMVLVLFFIFGDRCLDMFEMLLRRLLSLYYADQRKIEALVNNQIIILFRDIMEKINLANFSGPNLLTIVSLSFLIVALDGFCYFFILRAFGVPITWLQSTLGGCFMQIMFILPTMPVQIGTAEMYPVLIFSYGLGLSAPIVSSMAVFWHLFVVLVFTALGIISFAALGFDFRSLSPYTTIKER